MVGHNSKEVCALFVSFYMKPFIFKLKFDPIYFYCANAHNPCHNNPHAFLSRIPGMPNTSNLPQINLNQKNREM